MKRLMLAAAFLLLFGRVNAAQNADTDFVGTWQMTTNSPEGTNTNTMIIARDGDKLKATAKSARGERPYDSIAVNGSKISVFQMAREVRGSVARRKLCRSRSDFPT